ncbi:hypothetical protein LINGRAHAP2_LOCUS25024 [Linum grandiflorum]
MVMRLVPLLPSITMILIASIPR